PAEPAIVIQCFSTKRRAGYNSPGSSFIVFRVNVHAPHSRRYSLGQSGSVAGPTGLLPAAAPPGWGVLPGAARFAAVRLFGAEHPAPVRWLADPRHRRQ